LFFKESRMLNPFKSEELSVLHGAATAIEQGGNEGLNMAVALVGEDFAKLLLLMHLRAKHGGGKVFNADTEIMARTNNELGAMGLLPKLARGGR
jgi:hypothetical protein